MAETTDKLVTLSNLAQFKNKMDGTISSSVSAEAELRDAADRALAEQISNAVGGSKTTAAIQVLGGPLADDAEDNWPAAWKDEAGNKSIPEGITLQQVLENLFFAIKWGSPKTPIYSFNPTLANNPTASLSKTGLVPVGTEVTITYAANGSATNTTAKVTCTGFDYGYSTNGASKTANDTTYSQNASAGSVSGTLTASGTYDGDGVTSGDKKIVTVGEHTLSVSQSGLSVNPGNFVETSVYNVSNTGSVNTDAVFTVSDANANLSQKICAAKTTTVKVTGYYPIFVGQLATPATNETFVSSMFDELDKSLSSVPTKVTINAGTCTYFIAVPENNANYSKSGIKVYDPTTKDEFGKSNVTGVVAIPMLNNAGNENYKVFYISNAAGWASATNFVVEFTK